MFFFCRVLLILPLDGIGRPSLNHRRLAVHLAIDATVGSRGFLSDRVDIDPVKVILPKIFVVVVVVDVKSKSIRNLDVPSILLKLPPGERPGIYRWLNF